MSGLSGLTLGSFIVRGYLAGLAKLGVDAEQVRKGAGVPDQELDGVPKLVSISTAERLCKSAQLLTGDDLISLRVAMTTEGENFDLLGYVMRASDNLNQAFELLTQYERLVGNTAQFSLRPGSTYSSLRLDVTGTTHLSPLQTQALILGLVSIARRISDPPVQPAEVCFRQRRPVHADFLASALGCRVRYDCPNDLILYGKHTLAQPLPRRDPRLRSILERQAHRLLEQLPEEQDLVQSLRRLIMSELPAGTASADRIARRAGMSVRTMARHLRAVGTSYQRVLDQVRYERACDFLRGPEVEVSDVAFRMGFADASSFNRAFKRWSGVSPSTYRKEMLS